MRRWQSGQCRIVDAGEVLVDDSECCDSSAVGMDGRKGAADAEAGEGVPARETEDARDTGGRDPALDATEPAREIEGDARGLSGACGAMSHPKRAARTATSDGSFWSGGFEGDSPPSIDASESLPSDVVDNATDDMTDIKFWTWRLL